jgi:hypothetical protein
MRNRMERERKRKMTILPAAIFHMELQFVVFETDSVFVDQESE